MKLLYLIAFLVPLTINGQKVSQTHGEAIPTKTWHSFIPSKGVTIFSEDFASGIPSTWTNTTVSGPVDWKYTTVGHTGSYPTAALQATTAANGWIIVDSDADNFSGGSAEDSRLTSPVIDCSGFTNVKLEFQQMFRRWQQDITTVRITTDGGLNYTDFVLNAAITQQGTENPDYVNIDISSAIAGDPTNVQFEFWWQGAWDYGWQIDDVSIKEIDPNDIIVKKAAFDADIEYYQIPENHVQPQDFYAFVSNIGYLDQTNVQLNVNIDQGGTSVFSGSSNTIGTLTVGTEDSLAINSNFTPTSTGIYDVTFNAIQNEADDVIANNTVTLSYTVTDSIYAIDNNNYGGQWWNQNTLGTGSDPYELGALFEIVNDDKTQTVSVYIGDSSDIGVVFEMYIYEYDPSTGTATFLNQTDSYSANANDLGNWVTLPWFGYSNLNAGAYYLVSALHYGGSDRLFIGYGTNTATSGATLSNDGGGGNWLNQPRVPMIRLNVNNTLNVDEIVNKGLLLSPNPVRDFVTIQSESLNIFDYTIYDLFGKTIVNGKGNTKTPINVDFIAKGAYLISIRNNGSTINKKFIIE